METPFDLGDWLRAGREISVQQYWLAETLITACGFTGALLTLLCMLRKTAPQTALTLILSVIITNLIPQNPYFAATLQTWVQGKFLNFNGAAQFLSLLWPFLALWFLWHPAHSLKGK